MSIKETIREKWMVQPPARRKAIAIIAGLVLAVIAIVVFMQLGSGTAGWWSNRKTDKVLTKVDQKEEELNKLRAENTTLRQQAAIDHDRAELKTAEAEALKESLPQFDARINEQKKTIEETFNELEKDTAITGATVSDDERRQRICSKLAESNAKQPDARKRIKLSVCR